MKKKDAIKHFGGVAQTAGALGLSRQAVYQWPDIVPINKAWQIERMTGGKVPFKINDYRLKAIGK